MLQKHTLQSIYCSVTLPLFSFNFFSVIPNPQYASFDILDSTSTGRDKKKNISISVAEVCVWFGEFAVSLSNRGISLFTNRSRRDERDEDSVGAAVYSPDLALALKHKLPAETSIFSAEAWAIYQALILLESTSHIVAAIFSFFFKERFGRSFVFFRSNPALII